MNKLVIVPTQVVSTTLDELQRAGHARSERVLLWLARQSETQLQVLEAFTPIQEAEKDFFRIPREGMADLLSHLRRTRLVVAAQVHSHPELAFHSLADDYWAIVRHAGALSLVVPYFGLQSTTASFGRDTAVFELASNNRWVQVDPSYINMRYRIE